MSKLFFVSFVALLLSCNNSKTKKQDCVEKLNPDCICTMEYNPVCGCNNKTYGNACDAQCHGITKYKPGECK